MCSKSFLNLEVFKALPAPPTASSKHKVRSKDISQLFSVTKFFCKHDIPVLKSQILGDWDRRISSLRQAWGVWQDNVSRPLSKRGNALECIDDAVTLMWGYLEVGLWAVGQFWWCHEARALGGVNVLAEVRKKQWLSIAQQLSPDQEASPCQNVPAGTVNLPWLPELWEENTCCWSHSS